MYPHAVRRLLNEDRLAATHRLVRFVGIETYEAAGGVVTPDLFADDEASGLWLEDGGLVHRLAPEPGTPTPAEAAEAARLESRLEELYEIDPDDGSPEHLDELVALERQLDDLAETVEARALWPEELRARAGCLVTISDDGEFEFIPGLIRPEDAPAPRPGTESGEATPRAVSPAAAARARAGVGIGLEDDLRSIRATLVKAHLAHDFEAAFDLLLFQLARALFSRRPMGEQALDIAITESPDRPGKRLHDDDFAAWSPGERLLDEDRDVLALDWLRSEDDGAAFAALRVLPRTDKQALFAAALARTLSGQLAFEPAARLEATVGRHRGPRPPDGGPLLVASAQGPHPGDRPRGAGADLGGGARQGQEGRAGGGDGDRLRRRRPSGQPGRRDARGHAGLAAAGLPGLRDGRHGRPGGCARGDRLRQRRYRGGIGDQGRRRIGSSSHFRQQF